jgi:hypothetical protein
MITITEYDVAAPTEDEKIAALEREDVTLLYHAAWGDVYACMNEGCSNERERLTHLFHDGGERVARHPPSGPRHSAGHPDR